MIDNCQRQQALEEIRANIARNGQHVYVVIAETTPRFAYTIGLSESVRVELILAGAIFYMLDDVSKIIRETSAHLRAGRGRDSVEIEGLGSFSLREVDPSWARDLMLGVFDYYQKEDIQSLQIVPDQNHWTIDVPNMSAPWTPTQETVWKWLHEPWTYPVSPASEAITHLAALRGDRITEACRWEEAEWELFAGAGPDVAKEEMRIVPLGTLLAADPSLEAVLTLRLGTGLWPDADSEWHPWIGKGEFT